LDINFCSRVTDTGIELLIFQSKSTQLCKTLQKLFISCRGVTKKGIKMAVNHFSALQVLEDLKIFDVLVDVVQSSAKVQRQPQSFNFSFTRLEIRPAIVYIEVVILG
jgi:bacterioferritin-associated ferredoxin